MSLEREFTRRLLDISRASAAFHYFDRRITSTTDAADLPETRAAYAASTADIEKADRAIL